MHESTAQNSHSPIPPPKLERLVDPVSPLVEELRYEVATLRKKVDKLVEESRPNRFDIAIEWARWLGFIVLVIYGFYAAIQALTK